MSPELWKILLTLGVQLLGKLIPALGGLLGGPLGWIIGLIIPYLSGLLFDWAEKLARFNAIDKRVADIVNEAVRTREEFIRVNENLVASPEERAKAYEDFKAARRKFRVIPT